MTISHIYLKQYVLRMVCVCMCKSLQIEIENTEMPREF